MSTINLDNLWKGVDANEWSKSIDWTDPEVARAIVEFLAKDALRLHDRLSFAEAEVAALKHKAKQYDDVVAAVQAADGGRYRNDTIEALLHRLKQLEVLRAALEPFARFAQKHDGMGLDHARNEVPIVDFNHGSATITLGDLRRAAEAIQNEAGQRNPVAEAVAAELEAQAATIAASDPSSLAQGLARGMRERATDVRRNGSAD